MKMTRDQYVLNDREKLYESHVNQLRKLAWGFVSPSLGVSFEDLLSVTHQSFMKACDKYREGKGTKFNTFLHRVVRNDLINYIKKETRRAHLTGTSLENAPEGSSEENFRGSVFRDLIASLSEDARDICGILIHSPTDILEVVAEDSGPMIQRKILRYYSRQGWKKCRVERAFLEISQII